MRGEVQSLQRRNCDCRPAPDPSHCVRTHINAPASASLAKKCATAKWDCSPREAHLDGLRGSPMPRLEAYRRNSSHESWPTMATAVRPPGDDPYSRRLVYDKGISLVESRCVRCGAVIVGSVTESLIADEDAHRKQCNKPAGPILVRAE